MLPLPIQFIVAMLAHGINERMARRVEYLLEEVRVLRELYTEATGATRLPFTPAQRKRLAFKGKALTPDERTACCHLVRPSTILAWFRQLAAQKYDSSAQPRKPGRPRKASNIRQLVLRLANENLGWGYTKIRDALRGLNVNIARRLALPFSALEKWTARRTRHRDRLRRRQRGCCSPPWKQRLFASASTNQRWWWPSSSTHAGARYHARAKGVLKASVTSDNRSTATRNGHFRIMTIAVLEATLTFFDVHAIPLTSPAAMPSLSTSIVPSFQIFTVAAATHYNAERYHQGLGGRLVCPPASAGNDTPASEPVRCRSRLGGVLNFYHRQAA